MSKPKILITNDDGIEAPGIKALWRSVADFADVSIIAPAHDQSGVGVGITVRTPLQITSVGWERGTPAWKVTGTPADCVKLGIRVILEQKPDLIISGINRGSNSGRTLLYSGTVGGVIEGAIRGVPGVAFSFDEIVNPNFQLIEKHITPILQYTLEHPLPRGTIYNVNFPQNPVKGVRMARQGRSYWAEDPDERVHPEGSPYFWLGGRWDSHDEHEESDVNLLQQGYGTIVPVHVDELTDHVLFEKRKEMFNKQFSSS
jgi:5'-nucleotidase